MQLRSTINTLTGMCKRLPRAKVLTVAQALQRATAAMLWRHCTWLLAFKQQHLEASFWAYPPVRLHLLSVDRLSILFVILNIILMLRKVSSAAAAPSATLAILPFLWVAGFAVPVFAASALLWARPAAYDRYRTPILLCHRLVRVAALYLHQDLLSADTGPSTLLGVDSSIGRWAVVQSLLLRPTVFVWMQCFVFPVAFRYQCLFQLLCMPVALKLAGVNAEVLSRPSLMPATCEAYRYLRIFVLHYPTDDELLRLVAPSGSDSRCPPFAPQYVSWFFYLVLGMATPLVLLYAVEARHRLWFLSAEYGLRLLPSRAQLCTRALSSLFTAMQFVHFGISVHLIVGSLYMNKLQH